jgi:hypothetical protein
MGLHKTLGALGLSATPKDGVTYVKLGPNPELQLLRAQSCEIAVIVLERKKTLSDPQDRKLVTDLAFKIWRYGSLTANQLMMLQRPAEGDKPGGLIVKYGDLLQQLGFDLEQLLDQAPPAHVVTPGDEQIVWSTVSLVVTQSAKAWQLVIDGNKQWFPKSICKLEHDGANHVLVAPAWLLKAKGVKF